MTRRCAQCEYFNPDVDEGVRGSRGECRALPPGMGGADDWPLVKLDDWCGCFAERQKVGA